MTRTYKLRPAANRATRRVNQNARLDRAWSKYQAAVERGFDSYDAELDQLPGTAADQQQTEVWLRRVTS